MLNLILKNLQKKFENQNLPHALLFCTKSLKNGKDFLNFWQQWMLCSNHNKLNYCNLCNNCYLFSVHQHPDVLIFSTDNCAINIEQIRSIIYFTSHHSLKSNFRIIFIDNIASLNNSTATALLKIVEEPPKNVYFLFLAPSPNLVLPTLRSRCYIVYLPDINFKEELFFSDQIEYLLDKLSEYIKNHNILIDQEFKKVISNHHFDKIIWLNALAFWCYQNNQNNQSKTWLNAYQKVILELKLIYQGYHHNTSFWLQTWLQEIYQDELN